MRRLSAVAAMFAGSVALAHTGATGIVLERMQDMESIGQNMRGIAKMLSGEVPRDDAEIATRSEAIAAMGGAELVGKFPHGTGDPPSEAAAAIWEDPDGFSAAAFDMTAAAEALAGAARDGGDVNGAFQALGETCKSCHEGYRVSRD